ncbi:MAG: helix-turn-helix domain-containing protein [Bdellovibrionales bacterium]|nr:helix-turn-helix domain-containing protein [Bdellovibrionales bacterium]
MAKKLESRIPFNKRPRNARRLFSLRKKLALSQRELAQYFGVTPGAILLWEKGDRDLQGSSLKLLEIYEHFVEMDALSMIEKVLKR